MRLGHQQLSHCNQKIKVPLETAELYLHFILHLDVNLDVKGAVIKRHNVCYVVIIRDSLKEYKIKLKNTQMTISLSGSRMPRIVLEKLM